MCCKKSYIILFLLTLIQTVSPAQNDSVFNTKTISAVTLINTSPQKNIQLQNAFSTPLTLFFFLSPECPLCKDYSATMNSLQQQYGDKMTVYGIVPGKAYSAAEVKAFAEQYHFSFPLLIDKQQQLSKYLNASVTPEAILLNNHQQLVYKGAIDNLLEGLGKRRVKATANYLQNAISQTLSHQPVAIKRTKATGCKINNY
ncbi:redoxin domain-containing protein [Foetidibacter luteolus]|uniref:redoxin domain-containing protein n=1 Tax=Foetidibacter luteolus TaxID=2608880 RepID=UPI001F17C94C|nr:redoxin domain-containing protein [Foetidibacter luteolus]